MSVAQPPIRIREFEWQEIPTEQLLKDGRLNLGPAVEDQGKYFNTKLTPTGLKLQALGYTGVIPINDEVVIEVVPRVPVKNLSRLMEISGQVPEPLVGVTRRYERSGTIYPSLVALYAEALSDALGTVHSQGLLREYERREEVTSVPRGRLLVGRTVQQQIARGVNHRVAVTWFQRTTDNPANRCLRYAVWRLIQYNEQFKDDIRRKEYQRTARTLSRCLNELDGVHLDLSTRFLQDPIVTGRRPLPTLRRQYRPALDLALAIIGGHAVSLQNAEDGLAMPSLLIKMSDVFEAYLRQVLVRAAERENWPVRVFDGNLSPPSGAKKKNLLDSGKTHSATPDIVLSSGPIKNLDHRLVIEVKYKPAMKAIHRDDLNQTLAYGVSYRASELVIAQPKAGTGMISGLHHVGVLEGMTVSRYVFDLDAADLEIEEGRFASAMHGRGTASTP